MLVLVSQAFRIGVNIGALDIPGITDHWDTVRAIDNLVNGLGITTIGLAFLYIIIEIVASRQQLMVEHAQLTTEVARREAVERELRERETLLRGINTSALDGIIVIDNMGRVTYWNPAAERILGYRAEEMIGKPVHEFVASGEQQALYDKGLLTWQQTGEGPVVGKTTEVKAVAKSGGELDVELSVSSMDIAGEWHAVGIIRDVTDRKRMEEERREIEARVQYAQKLEGLGILAGGIAHDFNNLLQIILGNVNMLEMGITEASPERKFLDNLKRCVGRAASLTRQMLAYSGRGSFTLQPVNIAHAIQEMMELLASSVSKKVALRINLPEDLPPVEADVAQIEQVIMNLVINASESLDEEHGGEVVVSTMLLHCTEEELKKSAALFRAPEGDYVCLEVKDVGCGMDEETMSKLFDPFFTTKYTGRGLGLSAVLGIVNAHKGAITVESIPGEGTTVRVLFPVSSKPAQAAPKATAPASVSVLETPCTVLLVDDESDVVALGSAMLKELGCNVLIASDGLEAVDVFTQQCETIDCVLLDLSMPRMDGIETYQELRRIKPDVRVILASGYSEQNLEQRLAGQKVSAILAKPYDMRVLGKTLKRVITE